MLSKMKSIVISQAKTNTSMRTHAKIDVNYSKDEK
jgi:hypothetical protein